jgi:hypothetical protein
LSKKGDPFIHIDYDVLLWKKLPKKILSAEVFVQCPEDVYKHGYHVDKVLNNCPNLYFLKENNPDKAYNMGIFGGNDLDFIYNYSNQAIKFASDEKNFHFWQEYNSPELAANWKACIVEQLFLAAAALSLNKKITCLFNLWPSERKCENAGYTHLMFDKSLPIVKKRIKQLAKIYETKYYV